MKSFIRVCRETLLCENLCTEFTESLFFFLLLLYYEFARFIYKIYQRLPWTPKWPVLTVLKAIYFKGVLNIVHCKLHKACTDFSFGKSAECDTRYLWDLISHIYTRHIICRTMYYMVLKGAQLVNTWKFGKLTASRLMLHNLLTNACLHTCIVLHTVVL